MILDRDNVSIGEARTFVERGLAGPGVACPCCGQFCKVYRRKLYATMASWLIWLVRTHETRQDWIHVTEGPPQRGGDFAKLTYWKLIVQRPLDAADHLLKRTSGFWKPTDRGRAFVYGRINVPSHALVFDDRVLGFTDETVSIQEALGKRFDYNTLMQGIP